MITVPAHPGPVQRVLGLRAGRATAEGRRGARRPRVRAAPHRLAARAQARLRREWVSFIESWGQSAFGSSVMLTYL